MKYLIITLLFITQLIHGETVVLLIRHGETDWNVENRCQGHSDIPLNDKGHAQAKALALKLKQEHPNIAAIYSSDLSRAYDTAQETAHQLNLPIEKNIQLREIYLGEAEGLTGDERVKRYGRREKEIQETYHTRKERWDHTSIPSGETYNQLLTRSRNAIICAAAQHPNQTIAIFTHGRVIKTLIGEVTDSEKIPHFPNTGIAYFIYNDDGSLCFVKTEP